MTRSHCGSTSTTDSCSQRNGSSRTRRVARSRLVFSAVAILVSFASTVSASVINYPPQITAPASLDLPHLALSPDAAQPVQVDGPDAVVRLAKYELLRRSQSEDEDARRSNDDKNEGTSTREDGESRTTSGGGRTQSTADSDDTRSKTTLTVPVTRSTAQSSPTSDASPSPFPVPFDDALPDDFKLAGGDDSCPNFITALLSNATFQKCYPISMMIQTSSSFFQAQKQLLDIVRVLDRACSADVDFCTNYLEEAARNLKARENCGDEINAPNLSLTAPILQAYNGLRAYNTLYKATCLQDPEVDMYCFATAVTNTTNASDNYVYWMPLGLNLPGSSIPSCNQCMTETMAIYHSASADRSQLIAETYESAALQINTICGPSFVDAALPPADASFGLQVSPSLAKTLIGLGLGITLNFIL